MRAGAAHRSQVQYAGGLGSAMHALFTTVCTDQGKLQKQRPRRAARRSLLMSIHTYLPLVDCHVFAGPPDRVLVMVCALQPVTQPPQPPLCCEVAACKYGCMAKEAGLMRTHQPAGACSRSPPAVLMHAQES